MIAREQYAEVLAAHYGCCVVRGAAGNLAEALDAALPDPEQAHRCPVVPVEPDNHHNAVDCPYCLPDRTRVTEQAVREALDKVAETFEREADKALKYPRDLTSRTRSRIWHDASERVREARP